MHQTPVEEENQVFSPDTSLVFLGNPNWPCAFFEGHLFPPLHDDKLSDFYRSVETPLDILKDRRREEVLEVFRKLNPSPSLFSLNGEMNDLANGMLELNHLYSRFKMKIGTKVRDLAVPQQPFKAFLTEHVLPFVKSRPVHESCHGGEKGWSVRRSLETHLPVKSYLSFDMQDAFGQATINYVFGFYYDALEKLVGSEEGRVNASGLLAAMSTIARPRRETGKVGSFISVEEIADPCFAETQEAASKNNLDSALPQGSPLSVALFNRLMLPIDDAFYRYANRGGMKYSRWIDDFAITSGKALRFNNFEAVMRTAQEHFSLAPKKVFFKYRGHAYLLGHKIAYNTIEKIDRETFERERGEPLTGDYLCGTHPRGEYIYQTDWDDDSPPYSTEENPY